MTTLKKLARYKATGAILPPVRFWLSESAARSWMQRVKRSVILAFQRPEISYPLPDHKPRMMAHWTPSTVREWVIVPSVPVEAAAEVLVDSRQHDAGGGDPRAIFEHSAATCAGADNVRWPGVADESRAGSSLRHLSRCPGETGLDLQADGVALDGRFRPGLDPAEGVGAGVPEGGFCLSFETGTSPVQVAVEENIAGMEQERLTGLMPRKSPVAATGPATNTPTPQEAAYGR